MLWEVVGEIRTPHCSEEMASVVKYIKNMSHVTGILTFFVSSITYWFTGIIYTGCLVSGEISWGVMLLSIYRLVLKLVHKCFKSIKKNNFLHNCNYLLNHCIEKMYRCFFLSDTAVQEKNLYFHNNHQTWLFFLLNTCRIF